MTTPEIKPGDLVTFGPWEVVNATPLGVHARGTDGCSYYFTVSAITTHTPAPEKPLEVGEEVEWLGDLVTILAIDGAAAWIRNPSGYRTTALLSEIKRSSQ